MAVPRPFTPLRACGLARALALSGCAHSTNSPTDALDAYAAALREGRVRDAYELLSDDAKKSIPFEAFERTVKENPEEMKQLARALVRPSGDSEVTATVTAPDGRELTLRLEGGKWRVDRAAIDVYVQDTPQLALGSFVRAYQNKRYDILLRFVPDQKLEGLDAAKLKASFEGDMKEEMERLTRAVAAALPTATIEQLGDRATLSYGSGGTVELVLQHGVWKIEEF